MVVILGWLKTPKKFENNADRQMPLSTAVPGIPFRSVKVPGYRTGRSKGESGSEARL